MKETLEQTKTISGLHRSLEYEKRNIDEAVVKVQYLNSIMHEVEEQFGWDWMSKKVWTYGIGIDFKDLTENEYSVVKNLLSKIDKGDSADWKKESNQWNLSLTKEVVVGQVTKINFDLDEPDRTTEDVKVNVCFKWGIPDTCEIVTEEHEEEIRHSDIVEKDGKFFKVVRSKSVKCTKPVLESVFAQTQQNEA